MLDVVASIFQLTNRRYLMLPKLSFGYLEQDTGVRWDVSGGGSRAYTIRYGEQLVDRTADAIEKQNVDSHFMIQRLQSALILGGHGLFQAVCVGRIFFKRIQEQVEWFSQQDLPSAKSDPARPTLYDWLSALNTHTMLRRAAADALAALSHPHEAAVYVYRGLEWLVVGEGRSWDDLAADLGMSKAQVRDFKKLVNLDHGVRHASRSGMKLRGDSEQAAIWVCALIDAINATRARLEPGYSPASPQHIAETVLAAMPPHVFE